MIDRLHSLALKSLIHTLSSRGGEGRLSVLTFHQVLDSPDELNPDELNTSDFGAFLDFLGEHCQVLPLHDAVLRVSQGHLPKRAVSLTFDDGYPEWTSTVASELLKRNMHATFFITSGIMDGSLLWHEKLMQSVRTLPATNAQLPGHLAGENAQLSIAQDRLQLLHTMLRHAKTMPLRQRNQWIDMIESTLGSAPRASSQRFDSKSIHALDALGFGIGAHTIHHPILSLCSEEEAKHEIGASKEMLQAEVRQPVRYFAYPNGRPGTDFQLTHVDMARACGYLGAFTTSPGCVERSTDPFQQPRFGPWKASVHGFGRQLVRNLMATPDIAS